MNRMALPTPTFGAIVTHAGWAPLTLVAAVAAAGWYLVAVHRLAGARWPARRTVTFLAGVTLLAWTANGGLQAYADSLFWVWTSQLLMLLLVVPALLMSGQPVELCRRRGRGGLVLRLVDGPIGRVAANPLIGPALVPVICAFLFFGPIPGWAIQAPVVGWILQLVVTLLGCLIVLPAVDAKEDRTSVAIGLAMGIGVVELLLDAIPGIVMSLQAHVSSTFADHRTHQVWAPSPLHDQHHAGAILWCVAELLDLPFLAVLFVRWVRADAREAADIDTVLDAEQIVRAVRPVDAGEPSRTDEPWWLSDPRMRDRYRPN